MRSYWLLSPNIKNHNQTVPEWKGAFIKGRAAFIGYKPGHHPIGNRFANRIVPGDVIMIATRHEWAREIVGFGVVTSLHSITASSNLAALQN
jgi:hypothetical protein